MKKVVITFILPDELFVDELLDSIKDTMAEKGRELSPVVPDDKSDMSLTVLVGEKK